VHGVGVTGVLGFAADEGLHAEAADLAGGGAGDAAVEEHGGGVREYPPSSRAWQISPLDMVSINQPPPPFQGTPSDI